MDQAYDLVIIGGGSAGLTAARFSAQLGQRVALVEKYRIGGDCTWTGCVPSKTLLKVARVAQEIRAAQRYGLTSSEPVIDFKSVMGHVRSAIDDVYRNESPEKLRAEGIDILLGQARFVDPRTLDVRDGDVRLKARRFIIATGAKPLVPPIPGLDATPYLTYETVWDLKELPRRLIVIGAGPIGCELTQAYCRLGSQVTLLEAAPRVLLQDEPEAADLVSNHLIREGVDLRLNAMVQRVRQDSDGIHVDVEGNEVVGDALLLSVGRTPNVSDLDLNAAGVAYDSTGIQVNSRLRTTQKRIFAAGDCVGGYQFTHYAAWQGFMAVRNAFRLSPINALLERVPWATFTDPEVAHVGLTEEQARARVGDETRVCYWPMTEVDRAITDDDTSGFIKLMHRPNGRILGVTIVAGRAGEMIQEWSLAIDRGLKLRHLAESIHVYPTYSMATMQVAAKLRVDQVMAGNYGRLARGLARLAR